MSKSDSVSQWIEDLKSGDSRAATNLWNRYSVHLLRFARGKLNGAARRVADEEDLVIAAFHSFFQRAREGQFPELSGRNELWALLAKITERKAVNNVRLHMSQKRGGGRVRGESALRCQRNDGGPGELIQARSDQPTPEDLARLAELIGELDDELRLIVCLRSEGFSNEQIAGRVNRSVATVERRLRLLRDEWEEELL